MLSDAYWVGARPWQNNMFIFFLCIVSSYVEKNKLKRKTKNAGRQLTRRLSGDIPVAIVHLSDQGEQEAEAWPAQWISHTAWEVMYW